MHRKLTAIHFIGAVIPNALISIWAEVFDHSRYDITMQLCCTKLQKKDMFSSKVCMCI